MRKQSLILRGSTGDRLFDSAKACRYLDVPRSALYELDIPRVRLSEGRTRWRLSDLNAYIDRRTEK
jgi:predicted DNA-binding transcriptional regulator AlpA